MKKLGNDFFIISVLIILSIAIYLVHFGIFRDFYHISIYFLGDLGFMGTEALIVYFVINRLLSAREKAATRKKLNMLAGIFFYDLGIKVFNNINALVKNSAQCAQNICIEDNWTDKDFKKAQQKAAVLSLALNYQAACMEKLRDILREGKELIIRLMENPSLHEHEIFSDMLMALFHFTEELLRRRTLQDNDTEDKEHLLNDVQRLYVFLAQLWLEYMQHLKDNYNYLYLFNIKNRQVFFV